MKYEIFLTWLPQDRSLLSGTPKYWKEIARFVNGAFVDLDRGFKILSYPCSDRSLRLQPGLFWQNNKLTCHHFLTRFFQWRLNIASCSSTKGSDFLTCWNTNGKDDAFSPFNSSIGIKLTNECFSAPRKSRSCTFSMLRARFSLLCFDCWPRLNSLNRPSRILLASLKIRATMLFLLST